MSNVYEGHIHAQQSWLCKGPNSMKGHLEVMKENCEPGKHPLDGEDVIINNLEKAIQEAEDFYNAKENQA